MIMLINADARHIPLKDESIQCCVTSPPYWGLRDYGVEGQLGLEATPDEYVTNMVEVFREVRRVLKKDGTLWLNLGDSYNGSGGAGGDYTAGGLKEGQRRYPGRHLKTLKPKDLVGIPWRVAFALQADGWYLRQDIIWHKPNPMPESVKDRCTKAHEYVFLMTKHKKYYFNATSIAEKAAYDGRKDEIYKGGAKDVSIGKHKRWRSDEDGEKIRNKRSVWTITTKPYKGAHFATFPPKLVEPMILAGSRPGDIVLDPFSGSGTVGQVCTEYRRIFVGLELNREYIKLAKKRINKTQKRMLWGGNHV